jgi:hypothetical protein
MEEGLARGFHLPRILEGSQVSQLHFANLPGVECHIATNLRM